MIQNRTSIFGMNKEFFVPKFFMIWLSKVNSKWYHMRSDKITTIKVWALRCIKYVTPAVTPMMSSLKQFHFSQTVAILKYMIMAGYSMQKPGEHLKNDWYIYKLADTAVL